MGSQSCGLPSLLPSSASTSQATKASSHSRTISTQVFGYLSSLGSTYPSSLSTSNPNTITSRSSYLHTSKSHIMSPIIASPAARLAARTAGRRQFSMINTLRNFARGLEHAPYERVPQTPQAAADWGRQVKKAAGSAVVYVPAIGTFLAWPYIASRVMDGHVGQF